MSEGQDWTATFTDPDGKPLSQEELEEVGLGNVSEVPADDAPTTTTLPPLTPGMNPNGTYAKAKGGTEMMADRIQEALVESGCEDKINIIHSRVREIDPDKKNIYVVHDTWRDPECGHLKIVEDRKRFDKIVFVSNQQMQSFHLGLNVPYGESLVMKNAIDPIEMTEEKPNDRINLIYHTTPHRGLELLVPAFEYLAEVHPHIHLDVYSSFKIYGWDARDEQYAGLFDRLNDHPRATYHGYQSNEVVREALTKAHIFAYPNIWPETSCIAAIEAMSAKCDVVCPNFEALPETTAGFATEYQYNEDAQMHLNAFASALDYSIKTLSLDFTQSKLTAAKQVIDTQYAWHVRKQQWIGFFRQLCQE
jgi:UDP-glucose:(glucosyl)LPS alpha-1,2-glucosyltransferase